ncbi:MAG: Panacea domain-containing protein [Tepidisphaeraceae bacterium]|jgi:uncharacterized phage-associated protein
MEAQPEISSRRVARLAQDSRGVQTQENMIFRFNLAKTIQASAVLLKGEPTHRMSRLRLLKLLYIADRESLTERARPITGDRPVAMDHGPVLTNTYGLIKGEDYLAPEWEKYVVREGRDAVLASDPGVGDLSRYEIAKLRDVTRKFQDRDDWDVAEFTHTFAEWIRNKPAPGSSKPIPIEDVLDATGLLGLKDQIAADAAAEAAGRLLEST